MLLFFLLGSDVFINYRLKLVRPVPPQSLAAAKAA